MISVVLGDAASAVDGCWVSGGNGRDGCWVGAADLAQLLDTVPRRFGPVIVALATTSRTAARSSTV
jgi:hypothetical protein